MSIPLIAGLGPQELIIIAVVLVLLFGAKKLPELARGSGQALRIFKAETKALSEDDDKKTPEQRDIDARNESTSYEAPPPKPTANPGEHGEPERRTDTPG
jgi:sec-independent protein translocase protein TatA